MSKPFIISAIDVGTNSFHLVTASVDENGMLDILTREKESVRLGSSGGDMKYITSDAIKRGIRALKQFAEFAKNHNSTVRAIATSAVREALNQEDFIEKVRSQTGLEIEVVSGIEEARLINIGVLHALPIYNKKSLVIDIGGGSTETIVSQKGKIKYINSVKLGAIRLTKKYFDEGDVNDISIEECTNFIRGEWTPTLERIKECNAEVCIGTSGTITTLATMAYLRKNEIIPENLNGLKISSKDILKVINQIKEAKTPEKIAKLNGIDPNRTDIILGGSLIIEFALKYLEIEELSLSAYALREGIVYDTIQKQQAIEELHHLSDLRYQTITNLCKKFQLNMEHSMHVKELSLSIFEQLKALHNMSYIEAELLEAASFLHDIGFYVSHDKHHKHSYYIIKNCMMPGFTNNESEIIANIARYHRKSAPNKNHENFAILSEKEQAIVWLCGGILRLSEGLDRRQATNVKAVEIEYDDKTITITLIPAENKPYPDIELWGANRRRGMLELTLNRQIIFKIKE